jgi:hypothetical protein
MSPREFIDRRYRKLTVIMCAGLALFIVGFFVFDQVGLSDDLAILIGLIGFVVMSLANFAGNLFSIYKCPKCLGKLHGLFGFWCLDPAIHNCPHCKIGFEVEDNKLNDAKNNGNCPPFPWPGC